MARPDTQRRRRPHPGLSGPRAQRRGPGLGARGGFAGGDLDMPEADAVARRTRHARHDRALGGLPPRSAAGRMGGGHSASPAPACTTPRRPTTSSPPGRGRFERGAPADRRGPSRDRRCQRRREPGDRRDPAADRATRSRRCPRSSCWPTRLFSPCSLRPPPRCAPRSMQQPEADHVRPGSRARDVRELPRRVCRRRPARRDPRARDPRSTWRGFPPTLMINGEVDELRVSGEALRRDARRSRAARSSVSIELGTRTRPPEPTRRAPRHPASLRIPDRHPTRRRDRPATLAIEGSLT